MDGDTPYMAQRRTLHELKAKQIAGTEPAGTTPPEAAPDGGPTASKKKAKKKTG